LSGDREMTTQATKKDWDWDREKIEARVARHRRCDVCRRSFRSAKKVNAHKKSEHSY